MVKTLTLRDLTKTELLELLDRYVYSVSEREIVRIRYNSLIRKAGDATVEAINAMKSYEKANGAHSIKPNKSATEKYSKAMEFYNQAQELKSLEHTGRV